jgi:hypothetical protein
LTRPVTVSRSAASWPVAPPPVSVTVIVAVSSSGMGALRVVVPLRASA